MKNADKREPDRRVSEAERRRNKQEPLAKRRAETERKRGERKEIKTARKESKNKLKEQKRARAEKRFAARQKVYRKIKSRLKNKASGFDYENYGVLPRKELIVRGDAASVCAKFSSVGIDVRDMKRDGAFLRFKIRRKDLPKAIAILNEMCYTFKIGGTYGVRRLCSFWAVRFGIALGAVAASVAMNISYSYIWRIRITGTDALPKAAVESALYDAGFRTGRKKSAFNASDVAAAVNAVDGVSDCGVEISGTTLYVYVLESKDFTVRGSYAAYEAAYDATVTRIVVRSGTARVERGDIVKRGDMLADGDVYSSTGELLYTADCDADIYGEVSLVFTAEIGRYGVEYRRTGRMTQKTVFTLFGHKISKARSPYKSYESVATTANYDVLIPLYATTYRFYETAPVEVERDIDAAVSEYAREKARELEFTGKFDSSYTLKELGDDRFRVNLFLSGEAIISRGTDRVVKEDGENIAG